MADESFELEDGEVAASGVNDPSAADDVQLRAQLREAATVMRQRGQPDLARLALGLVDADFRDATWVVDDQVRGGGDFSGDPALFDTFRHMIRGVVLRLQEAGYAEQVAARLVRTTAVPASAAAVRSLEKQTFRAAAGGGDDDDGVTECSICLKEFVDGGQVSLMPCPSRGHKFHPDCIAKWLGISNVCPLCRHELPACLYYDYE